MSDAPTVVVTGASSGIGAACAQRLDAAGMRVFAGVRREADAEALARRCSSRLTPLRLDVTDAAQIAAAAAAVAGAVGARGLSGLVNNAGISGGDPVEFADIDAVRAMLEVNLVGTMAVTRALLPRVRAARGRVVCIGSIGGRLAVPFLSAYSASKAGVAAFCDSLRVELAPWGIRVVLVEPGAVRTAIWGKGLATLEERRASLPPAATALYGGAVEAMAPGRGADRARRGRPRPGGPGRRASAHRTPAAHPLPRRRRRPRPGGAAPPPRTGARRGAGAGDEPAPPTRTRAGRGPGRLGRRRGRARGDRRGR